MAAALASAGAAQAAPDRPFKASMAVEEHLGNIGRCATSPGTISGLGGTLSGTGHATHMGALTVGAEHCVQLRADQSVYISAGHMVLTGANGDVVRLDYTGTFTPVAPGVYAFEGHYDITDGTGRFVGASGAGPLFGTLQGTLPSQVQTLSLTAEGGIRY
jgi:hypothetical protein